MVPLFAVIVHHIIITIPPPPPHAPSVQANQAAVIVHPVKFTVPFTRIINTHPPIPAAPVVITAPPLPQYLYARNHIGSGIHTHQVCHVGAVHIVCQYKNHIPAVSAFHHCQLISIVQPDIVKSPLTFIIATSQLEVFQEKFNVALPLSVRFV